MKTIGQIYLFPTACFLIYKTQQLSQAAHALSLFGRSPPISVRGKNSTYQDTTINALEVAEYWSFRLTTTVHFSKNNQPLLLIEHLTIEDRNYCQILIDEKVGWISYNKEEDLPFFTENPEPKKEK